MHVRARRITQRCGPNSYDGADLIRLFGRNTGKKQLKVVSIFATNQAAIGQKTDELADVLSNRRLVNPPTTSNFTLRGLADVVLKGPHEIAQEVTLDWASSLSPNWSRLGLAIPVSPHGRLV